MPKKISAKTSKGNQESTSSSSIRHIRMGVIAAVSKSIIISMTLQKR